jgi:NAD(P)H-hydrate epimerase
MPKILTVEQMHALEAAADKAGLTYADMMQTAGRAVADRVEELIAELPSPDARVAILVGKGNNGGDGLVVAKLLAAETSAIINLFLTEPRDESDPVFAAVREAGLFPIEGPTDAEQGFRVLKTMVSNADIIVDALLGTGATLPIKGDLEKILRTIHTGLRLRQTDRPHPTTNTPASPVLAAINRPIIVAVDLPTGLNADTGALDPHAIHADETITFEAVKPGMLIFPGAAAVGMLHVAPLGIPEKTEPLPSIKHVVIDAAQVKALLPKRPADAHKGTFGKALLVAGSVNYSGAASLAAIGAYRVGTGLVTVAAPQAIIPTLAARLVEATWLLLPHDMGVLNRSAARVLREELAGCTALLIGPGLGQETPTAEFLEAFFQPDTSKAKVRTMGFGYASTAVDAAVTDGSEAADKGSTLPPLVIDADGLNLLAKVDQWWTRLPANTILTPHPGEMARLSGIQDADEHKAIEQVQNNRIGLAVEKAAAWNVVIVLKGAFTVIAAPDGRVAILPFATPSLARAGTGDLLAGMVTGLLAQGLAPFDAAIAAGYLHGYAGELATGYVGHSASVLASDVAEHIPDALATVDATTLD